MSVLKTVGMELIHANPYRLINTYPYIEPKLDSLVRSINDVGFWEGVIARPNPDGKGYQIAFGHHRIEAAKRAGLNRAPIIVRDLTDEQMIQFMGRENGEDYKADFITMLNTWEGAIAFSKGFEKPVEIARLLGWTQTYNDDSGVDKMLPVAKACANAHSLIESGAMEINDFSGMTVYSVNQMVAPAVEQIKKTKRTAPEQVAEVTKKAAAGVKKTADSVRRGDVKPSEVGLESRSNIREKVLPKTERQLPDFVTFARKAQKGMDNLFAADALTFNVEAIIDASEHLVRGEDMNAVDGLIVDMREAMARGQELLSRLERSAAERRSDVTGVPALMGGK